MNFIKLTLRQEAGPEPVWIAVEHIAAIKSVRKDGDYSFIMLVSRDNIAVEESHREVINRIKDLMLE